MLSVPSGLSRRRHRLQLQKGKAHSGKAAGSGKSQLCAKLDAGLMAAC